MLDIHNKNVCSYSAAALEEDYKDEIFEEEEEDEDDAISDENRTKWASKTNSNSTKLLKRRSKNRPISFSSKNLVMTV